MKTNLSIKFAKGTVYILNHFLSINANSNSCYIVYQPKAPEKLARYKKKLA